LKDNASSFITNNDYSLFKSTLLDSGSTIDVFNDLSRFQDFRKAPRSHTLRCGNHFARILGYGTVDVDIIGVGRKGKRVLRIKEAAYCPDFMTNLVSFANLKKRGIFWDTERNQLYRSTNKSVICTLTEIGGQQVINYRPIERRFEAFATNRLPRSKTSRDPRPLKKGDGLLWHHRLGHAGPTAIRKLGENALGTKLVGPRTVECPHCAVAKIKRQIARRAPMRDRLSPGREIHIDWTDLEEAYDGFVRIMFITDAASGLVTPYFMSTFGTERENLTALKDYIEHQEKRYGISVRIVRSDLELFRKKTCRWLTKKRIDCEPSAPRTPAQNGLAERSGGVIMGQSRAMRIGANFPHDLWKEIINTAVYLHNRTPREGLGWKSPYEVFYTHTAKMTRLQEGQKKQPKSQKPQLAHLKAYGCRAYAMTDDAQLKDKRLLKLNPRAHIGYLVGYDSTNIYRVWIPHQGKVISTRDVLFDEDRFFEGKGVAPERELIAEMDELVVKVSLDSSLAENEKVLEIDEEIVYSDQEQVTGSGDEPDDEVMQFAEDEEDYVLSREIQEGLITPPEDSSVEKEAFAVTVPFQIKATSLSLGDRLINQLEEFQARNRDETPRLDDREKTPRVIDSQEQVSCVIDGENRPFSLRNDREKISLAIDSQEQVSCAIDSLGQVPRAIDDEDRPSSSIEDRDETSLLDLDWDGDLRSVPGWNDRFKSFQRVRIGSAFHGVFEGHRLKRLHKRNVPPEPKTIRDLKNHPFRKEFENAQKEHLQSHEKMKSFREIDQSLAKGHQILGCMWVFLYKTDKQGFVSRFKARLVVWGNHQANCGLPTRATTLASTAFRTLMAITAKYDLETQQVDAVNAFVNCDLDETVFMKLPPGYEKPGKILKLRKALYGLRRSPLLWQQELTRAFTRLGFKEIPQEPCVMMKGGIIVFFYVDDIVFCFKKEDRESVNEIRRELETKFELKHIGELKWFLGIHVLRDRRTKQLWLSQQAYIDKLTARFDINTEGRLPDTPMAESELMPSPSIATKKDIEAYQRKTGSILFAAITTRPDVAFACSRLARFNTNPNEKHHEAADRVLRYLHKTRGYTLQYGGNTARPVQAFICASDASFADNSLDRKSSQGFIMTLFGGPIAWKASKQDTVTTSSTEAELLALSQTAKEAIFISRLLKGLTLYVEHPLTIQCDNRQTIRLLTEESAKLNTKLRHVDIHRHWLRQEVQEKRITLEWVPTKEMLADGLTKPLGKQKHLEFCRMIGLSDEKERLNREFRLEELKDSIREQNKKDFERTVVLGRTPKTGKKMGFRASDFRASRELSL
jgi:transposase InsO family protein